MLTTPTEQLVAPYRRLNVFMAGIEWETERTHRDGMGVEL